ncbi:hypothetical protein ACWCPX_22155 [Streptomyces olivaceoviridis]
MAESTAANVPKPRQAQSIRAEQRFLAALAELGATPLYDEWKGSEAPHRARCANGHECAPWPSGVFKGQGICKECVGMGPKAAWDAFRELVTSQGGIVLEDRWLGAITRHRVKCAAGHITAPRPHDARATGSFCSACAGRNAESAWQSFRALVAEKGGLVVETEWLGNHAQHRIVCPNGHEARVRPSKVASRKRIPCRRCTYDRCAAQFEELVRAQGGMLLEPYKNSAAKHLVRCANGHEVKQTPAHLVAGNALCRRCAYKEWDAFYVVVDEVNDLVKFGITSGSARRRLAQHEKDGFDVIVRVYEGLPGDMAPELEQNVLAALRDAGESPVRGREYFPARVLPIVLDLVDNHPACRSGVE